MKPCSEAIGGMHYLFTRELSRGESVKENEIGQDRGFKGRVYTPKEFDEKQALKFDDSKPDPTMIPRSAVEGEAKALGFGAAKYDRNNWKKGMKWSRPAAAALRHLYAWLDGEDIDPESGLNHLYHVKCNLSFLIEYQEKAIGEDDR